MSVSSVFQTTPAISGLEQVQKTKEIRLKREELEIEVITILSERMDSNKMSGHLIQLELQDVRDRNILVRSSFSFEISER
ncbi:hypothetical protein TNCV_727771 [Trichonephila clavipes]|nr:hypothetical protein TNCV_727771 [Trichonephila clavipes]